MDIIEIRKNLENLPDSIYEKELEYNQEKAVLNYMNDLTKHIIAKEKSKVLGTNAFKEETAFASEAYRIHIEGLKEQEIKTAQLGAEHSRLKNIFEAMRSLNKNV